MINKTARRVLFSVVMLVMTFFSAFTGFSANAAALTLRSVSLTNSTPSASAGYTINFTTATSGTLTEIDFQFSKTASGVTVPASLTTTGATLGTTTNINSSWVMNNATNGLLKLTNAGQAISPSTAISVTFDSVTSPLLTDCNGNSSATTCFIQITTFTSGPTALDNGAASFTLINSNAASATVDPSLTLLVSGVASATVTAGGTTTQTSTANTLPFGDLVAGATSTVAQELQVTTNAQHGYNLGQAMVSDMVGTSGDVICPFVANSATWSAPQVWTTPTTQTGLYTTTGACTSTAASAIGANTSDFTGVPAFTSGGKLYGPVSQTYNNVSVSSSPDQATAKFVTYVLGTDVYAPADLYQGTLRYRVVPQY